MYVCLYLIYLTAFCQLHMLCIVHEVMTVMKKSKGCERKGLLAVVWQCSNLCSGGTEETTKIAQSGYPFFRPSIEPLNRHVN